MKQNQNQGTQPYRQYRRDEIDLLELLAAFRRRLWLIILAAVIGGGIAGAFSKFVLIPQYTSTAMVYVLSKETTLTSLADLQIGSQLTKDYKVIVTSRPVLEEVIERLNLDMSYRELRNKLTIGNPTDTRILSLSVVDPDPQLAKRIVDQVAETSSDYIGDIMEMVPPKIIETGEVPQNRTSPNNSKNALMGAMVGVMAVCGVITVEMLLNDTIQTEEDAARYIGVTVLASVPQRAGEAKAKTKQKKEKK